MSKDKLFSQTDVQHTVHRAGYDLSEKVHFTAKAGELLPVYHRTVMPGDEFRINPKLFTRTAPSVSCPFTQLKEYIDILFVPYRQLWRNAPAVFTKNTANPMSAMAYNQNTPVSSNGAYFNYRTYLTDAIRGLHNKKNQFGYDRASLSFKLFNYLGYSYINDQLQQDIFNGTNLVTNNPNIPSQLSAFPLLAYHKIYNDFYRNSRWESSVPYNFNIDYSPNGEVAVPAYNQDYYNSPTLFDLHYASFPKDIFFGMLPSSQLGDDVMLSAKAKNWVGLQSSSSFNPVQVGSTVSGMNKTISTQGATGEGIILNPGQLDQALSNSIKYLDIRNAQFLQHYKEVIGSGNQDYPTIIKKLFGYDVNESLTGNVTYLGGNTNIISFNEQVNNNLTDNNLPTISATGKGSSNDEIISFNVPEHGIIMAIYHCMPIVDYCTDGFHFDITKVSIDDYANPAFDTLGFEQLKSQNFYVGLGSQKSPVGSIGWNTRFADYKTGFDRVLGDFRETQKNWLAPVDLDYLKEHFDTTNKLIVDASTFQCDPAILNPIFALKADSTVQTDQLLCSLNMDIQAVRCLDRTGMPKDF